jgi:hypothetical protein
LVLRLFKKDLGDEEDDEEEGAEEEKWIEFILYYHYTKLTNQLLKRNQSFFNLFFMFFSECALFSFRLFWIILKINKVFLWLKNIQSESKNVKLNWEKKIKKWVRPPRGSNPRQLD